MAVPAAAPMVAECYSCGMARMWLVICGLYVTFWLAFWLHIFMRAVSAFF
jgi:hypothetical protein